jgi:myo-inositol-1(or 4)-monophosphatase
MSSRHFKLPIGESGEDALAMARRCVLAGGRLARERFRQPTEVGVKGRGNIVTETDLAIESRIAALLAREFPNHVLLSEESHAQTSADEGWTWVLDPLDGTRNYASGIPFFCTNLALSQDGEPIVAATYDPVHRELFSAVKGQGAWVNDEPIHASNQPSLQASVLGIDMGYSDVRGAYMLKLLQGLWPGMQSVRIPGSAALGLAYAACGRFDLFVHNYLFPWDVTAGILLVREAGGAITDRDGNPVSIESEGVIAGGSMVHADFLRLAAGSPWRDGEARRQEK